MKQIYNLLLFTFIITYASKSYSQEGAIYNSSTTGTLVGVPFIVSNINNSSLISYDFSTSNFSSAPLSDTQQSIDYSYDSNWSITFDTPIENLRLYCKYWRTQEVSFNHSFTILCGSNIQNPNGNVLNTTSYSDAIIEFSDPITTLSLTIISGGGGSYQAMTFGTSTSLSTSDFEIITNKIKLYPNPSNEFIQVSNLKEKESYRIYNTIGTEIKSRTIFNQEKIDTRNFTNGLYFLKFDNGNTIKFIKE